MVSYIASVISPEMHLNRRYGKNFLLAVGVNLYIQ